MAEKINEETGEVLDLPETLYGPGPGREDNDPHPLAIPAGFNRPETLAEQVQRLVRGSISREAEEAGMETFEEANDFDIPDDPVDPQTPYEEQYDPVLGRGITPDEFQRNEGEYLNEYQTAAKDMTRAELMAAYGIDPDDRPGLPLGESGGGPRQGPEEAPEAPSRSLTGDGGAQPPLPFTDAERRRLRAWLDSTPD